MSQWYCLDDLNQALGPFTVEEIKRSNPDRDVMVWKEGMADWCPASALNVFKSAGQSSVLKNKELLLSLCREVVEDGFVSNEEVAKLRAWLDQNNTALSSWPGNVVGEHLSIILADGQVEESEREQLLDSLRMLTGARPKPDQILQIASRLPLDDPPPLITFAGKSFCFIGKFLFGSIKKCQAAVTSLGSETHASPKTETDYIVLGSVGCGTLRLTDKWEKVEKALSFKKSGYPCAIMSEEVWARAVMNEGLKSDSRQAEAPRPLPALPRTQELTKAGGRTPLLLPIDPEPSARELHIESSSGRNPYLVDLQTHTCTCPDFMERRSHFSAQDLRRACKHICTATIRRQLVTSCDFLTAAVLRASANSGRGGPCEQHMLRSDVDGWPILISYGDSEWVNVYAPERSPGKEPAYDRFGYNVVERRWSYSTSPANSTKIKDLIHKHVPRPSGNKIQVAEQRSKKAGCLSVLTACSFSAVIVVVLILRSKPLS